MKTVYIVIILALLFVTQFFSYKNWNVTLGGQIANYISILLFLYVLYYLYKIRWHYIDIQIVLLLGTPLLSYLSLVFYSHGDPVQIKNYLYPLACVALYFVYRQNRIKESDIVIPYLIIGFAVLLIQIFQQLNLSSALFGLRTEEFMESYHTNDIVEIRNGIYRFRLDVTFYATFVGLYYCWEKYLYKQKTLYLCLFILLSISIYLYLARQIMFVSFAVVAFSFLLQRGMNRIKSFLLVSIFLFILYVFHDSLFGQLMKHASSDSELRMAEYLFFWGESTKNPIVFLFGHGYGNQLTEIQATYRYYASDVGVIGQMYYFGFIWIVVFFVSLISILYKYWHQLPLYINMFLITILFDSVLISPFSIPSHRFTYVTILYLCYYHVIKKNIVNSVKCVKRKPLLTGGKHNVTVIQNIINDEKIMETKHDNAS